MKDVDARERLGRLEVAFTNLPQLVADAVLTELQPTIDALDSALVVVNQQTAAIKELAVRLDAHDEMMQVLDSELNSTRVDITAIIKTSESMSVRLVTQEQIVPRILGRLRDAVDVKGLYK